MLFIGNRNIGNFDQKRFVVFLGKRQFSSLQASNAFHGLQFVIYYSWKEGAWEEHMEARDYLNILQVAERLKDTPSFAISLYKEYRGQGIGTQLMKDMPALLKKRAMREHRWQYKKPIMLSGCTRRSDSGLWMRMTKSLLWCVNYESDQLF